MLKSTSRRLASVFLISSLLSVAAASCGKEDEPASSTDLQIQPVAPQQVQVGQSIRVELAVNNPSGASVEWTAVAPPLPSIGSTWSIVGSPDGAVFQWTPLVSHTGEHVFEIVASAGDAEARQTLAFEVLPGASSAPVFVRPGAGATFDLQRTPCLSVPVEARDDDSLAVVLDLQGDIPAGMELIQSTEYAGTLQWCPTPAQLDSSLRWTVTLSADDGEHTPVLLRFTSIFLRGPKEGCEGTPPEVSVLSPSKGDEVASASGYRVQVRATDVEGIRDTPVLYWSLAAPDDEDNPDITEFEQLLCTPDGDVWNCVIPPLGLQPGETRIVYAVASATDNDDATGTACDKRTNSELLRFIALGAEAGEAAAECSFCFADSECESGRCVDSAVGPVCLSACADDCAACEELSTVSGVVTSICLDAACLAVEACEDDAQEPNDSLSAASALVESIITGQICAENADFYRVPAIPGESVRVVLDGFIHDEGDLDLGVLTPAGANIASSAGVEDVESVEFCVPSEVAAFVIRVDGYAGSQNAYLLSVEEGAGSCCLDDAAEPDDARALARELQSGDVVDGVVCGGNEDWFAVELVEAGTLSLALVFDDLAIDLDMDVYDPSGRLAAQAATLESEILDVAVTEPGFWFVRVYGGRFDSGEYLLEATVVAQEGCSASFPCSGGAICVDGDCVVVACESSADCGLDEVCAGADPDAVGGRCVPGCEVNRDCLADEACKWLVAGRGCGLRGEGLNGDPCTSLDDCGGQRTCVGWPSGYCARAGCSSDVDCETGTVCFQDAGTGSVCALDCTSDATICRSGYRCVSAGSGSSRRVCAP